MARFKLGPDAQATLKELTARYWWYYRDYERGTQYCIRCHTPGVDQGLFLNAESAKRHFGTPWHRDNRQPGDSAKDKNYHSEFFLLKQVAAGEKLSARKSRRKLSARATRAAQRAERDELQCVMGGGGAGSGAPRSQGAGGARHGGASKAKTTPAAAGKAPALSSAKRRVVVGASSPSPRPSTAVASPCSPDVSTAGWCCCGFLAEFFAPV